LIDRGAGGTPCWWAVVVLVVTTCCTSRANVEPLGSEGQARVVRSAAVASVPTDARQPETTDSKRGTWTDPAPHDRIDLRHAGNQPRRTLRHRFESGQHQELTVSLTTKVEGSGDAEGEAAWVVELPVVSHVEAVDGAGTARFRFELGPVRPEAIERLGGNADGARLVRGLGGITARGVFTELRVGEPGQPTLARLASLLELAVPLPEQAVGVGAIWLVAQRLDEEGEAIQQRTEFHLTNLEDDRFEVTLRREQKPVGSSRTGVVRSDGRLRTSLGRVLPTGTLQMTTVADVPGLGTIEIQSSVSYLPGG
jgi:hypothetical protein